MLRKPDRRVVQGHRPKFTPYDRVLARVVLEATRELGRHANERVREPGRVVHAQYGILGAWHHHELVVARHDYAVLIDFVNAAHADHGYQSVALQSIRRHGLELDVLRRDLEHGVNGARRIDGVVVDEAMDLRVPSDVDDDLDELLVADHLWRLLGLDVGRPIAFAADRLLGYGLGFTRKLRFDVHLGGCLGLALRCWIIGGCLLSGRTASGQEHSEDKRAYTGR